MTVLFRNLRLIGYVVLLILAGGVLGITAFFASQFLHYTRYSYSVYSLVAPSVTIALLIILLYGSSRPSIDAVSLLILAISWLALAAWTSDINGPTDCYSLGSSRVRTKHGTISSRTFCYEAKTVEGISWSIFILLMISLILVITLASKSQALGWPDIWNDDINDLPWFGEYPGYPGGPLYTQGPPLQNQSYPVQGGQMVINGSVVQHQPGYSIVIWPGVNGEPARVEHRPGIVTHSTLSL